MSKVTSVEEAKRSKRQTGDADSDSYEEYKSDEDTLQGGGGNEEDATKNDVTKVEIISEHKDEKAVDGITEKEDAVKKESGDKKKEKRRKEKHSKHSRDAEGGEMMSGQEKKEKKKERKSKEGKKEKKSKEQRGEEKTTKVKTEKAQEENKAVSIEEARQAEQPEPVEIGLSKDNAEESTKLSEAPLAKPGKVESEAEPSPAVAPSADREPVRETEAAASNAAASETTASQVTGSTVVAEVAAHPAAADITEVPVPEPVKEEAAPPAAATETPVPEKAEEKSAPPVTPTEITPPEAALPETEKETTTVPVALPKVASPAESVKEQPPAAEAAPVTEPPVAKQHAPEPSQPSSDAALAKSGDHPFTQSDATLQPKASSKVETLQAASPQQPRGVQQILEHARKEAEERASGSSRLLMARSLVARQEKLQEQLTNIRHDFGDIDSEIRALKIDCYRNQRTFAKHH